MNGLETVVGCRVVLGVGRTLTSTIRLLDALEIFRSDPRVQVLFTIDSGSRFSDGTGELLRDIGARVLTPDDVASVTIDLVLAASENADPGPTEAPIVVLPHGVGFHKILRDTPDGSARLSGMIPEPVAGGQRVTMVLTDHRQRAQLEAYRPGASEQTVVLRDLFQQRMLASVRLRDQYRQALGVGLRKLVVVSSTWGEQALFGRWQGLPARLLRELPADEYTVLAILHPNTWYGHGPWQVRSWLADARDAGLILVPATGGWQAALVAADAVIGDHGSVTFYAATLGRPVLLGSFGTEVVPGTPMDDLGRLVPRLEWAQALLPQLQAAMSSPRTDQYRAIAARAFEADGESSESLTGFLYAQLGLSQPPSATAIRAWPIPQLQTPPVTSFTVRSRAILAGTLEISRYPVAVDQPMSAVADSPDALRHLAAYDDELDASRWQSAETVTHRGPLSEAAALEWISRHRGEHLLVAVSTAAGVLIGNRAGEIRLGSAPGLDPMFLTTAVYHLIVQGLSPTTPVTLVIGERQVSVTFQRY